MEKMFFVSNSGIVHIVDDSTTIPVRTRCRRHTSTVNMTRVADGATFASWQGSRHICGICAPTPKSEDEFIEQYDAAARGFMTAERAADEKRRQEFADAQVRGAKRTAIAENILDRIETLVGATGEIVFERSKVYSRKTTGTVIVDGEKFEIEIRI